MMATTVATPVKQSSAQIAGGDSQNEESTQKSVKPAPRGSLLRFCRGKVITMLNQCGWLMLYGEVDHPSVEKHGGDVYVHKDDVVDGETPCSGDIVTFYLYEDDNGFGAEKCIVAQRAEPVRVDEVADVFLRMSLIFASADQESDDEELDFHKSSFGKPVRVDEVADVFSRMSQIFASADEESDDEELDFHKSSFAKPVLVDEVADVFSRMSQIFASADEESGDEEQDFDKSIFAKPVLVDEVADVFLRMSLIFASADGESDDEELDFEKPRLAKRAPSCDGSTSGGGTSDSEQETFSETASDSEEETSSVQ